MVHGAGKRHASACLFTYAKENYGNVQGLYQSDRHHGLPWHRYLWRELPKEGRRRWRVIPIFRRSIER